MKLNKINLSGVSYDLEDLNAAKTVELTQAQYDALAVKDPNTFYVITDAEPVDMSDYYTKDEVDDELDGKADTATTYTKTEVDTALGAKQATLVSGTNIKTVNNESLLGSGNIEIQGGGATYSAGTNISIDANNAINCTLPISSIKGYNGIIVGKSSYGNGYRHIVGGLNCNVNAKGSSYTPADCLVIGEYLNAHNTAEVAFGRYNTTVQNTSFGGESGTTIFSVGNGTANNARHNAFEIRKNGDIYISKDGVDVKLQDQLGGTVDTELDSTSENPVQNKVIYQKFDEVEEVTAAALNDLNDKIGDINTLLEGI